IQYEYCGSFSRFQRRDWYGAELSLGSCRTGRTRRTGSSRRSLWSWCAAVPFGPLNSLQPLWTLITLVAFGSLNSLRTLRACVAGITLVPLLSLKPLNSLRTLITLITFGSLNPLRTLRTCVARIAFVALVPLGPLKTLRTLNARFSWIPFCSLRPNDSWFSISSFKSL